MFDITNETGRYLICHCSNHLDKIPSLYINKVEHNGKPIGFWYCFSCQAQGQITPEEVLAMSKKRAKGGTKHRSNAPIDWNKLQSDAQQNIISMPWEIHDALADSWNVAPIVPDYFGLGMIEGWYSFPFRDAKSNVTGIQLRSVDGKKLCIEGSKLGLFIHGGWPYEPVVVTEGVSDGCVSLHHGFFTIAKPNCSVGNGLVRDFLENTGYKGSIVICSDNDPPGIKGAEELKSMLSVHNVKIVYPPAKDLRKFHQDGGNVKGLIDDK